jgi:hypothetical protein
MDTRLIRQLWSAIESFPLGQFSNLDDSNLLKSIVDLLQSDPSFEPHNVPIVNTYLQSRMPLIRDVFQHS